MQLSNIGRRRANAELICLFDDVRIIERWCSIAVSKLAAAMRILISAGIPRLFVAREIAAASRLDRLRIDALNTEV